MATASSVYKRRQVKFSLKNEGNRPTLCNLEDDGKQEPEKHGTKEKKEKKEVFEAAVVTDMIAKDSNNGGGEKLMRLDELEKRKSYEQECPSRREKAINPSSLNDCDDDDDDGDDNDGDDDDGDDDGDESEGDNTDVNKNVTNKESNNQELLNSYQEACRIFGTIPTSIFLRQCTTSTVDLKHYGLGDKGTCAIAMAMRKNHTLECLNLHDNGIRDAGIKSICDMMACNCSLTKLDLSGNPVGKAGMAALGEMLQVNVYLKDLNLSGCGIQTGSDVDVFISSLDANNQLECLNISNNEIGDNGAIRLGSVLLGNCSLKRLNISWNNIRSSGAQALRRGLCKNDTLSELDLSWNGLGNPGAESVKQVLIDNKSLKILDLCCNRISVEGIKHIALALQRNRTLQVLKIGKNPFLSSGASRILKSLLANQHSGLVELVLDDVVFNEECEDDLSALLEQNPMFLCTWDLSIKGGSVVSGRRPEPMELLLACINEEGFRLIDFYRILMNDYAELLLKKEEFVSGIKKRNFPFSEKQLRALFDVLDTRKSGSITFDQFRAVKNYRNRKIRLKTSA